MSATLSELDFDWTDFERTGEQSRAYLRELGADKARLREMVLAVEDDPKLLGMCERHQLLDYIVLHDAPSGWRLRVHMSTGDHLDRPHDHRFSFSSLIVCGGYEHTWHHPVQPLYDEAEQDPIAREHQAKVSPDRRELATQADLIPYVTRFEQPGSCYTMHHSVIHTTITTDDTVSLFLRGPAEKDRSIIMDSETGTLWWRYGRGGETPERRAQKQMGVDYYRELCARLERLDVI